MGQTTEVGMTFTGKIQKQKNVFQRQWKCLLRHFINTIFIHIMT